MEVRSRDKTTQSQGIRNFEGDRDLLEKPTVAVVLPCYNEGKTIAQVVHDFRCHLPDATIYVYDNNSNDDTITEAKRAGAEVRQESMQGKGFVVRRALSQVDADILVLADGDGTYDAASAPKLVKLLCSQQLDMVVAVREPIEQGVYPSGHQFGNRLFNSIVAWLFGKGFRDIFSGYRALSRPFVKSFPSVSKGFEIETEISVHALQLDLPTAELVTPYTSRMEGTASKLRTYADGTSILIAILRLLRHQRPFLLFGVIALLSALISLAVGIPIIAEFLRTGLVPRFPSAVLAASLMVIAVIDFVTGIILDSVAHAAREQKRLSYLSIPRRI
jgi:glycosyltransferase involved in cell wall biosynthesis